MYAVIFTDFNIKVLFCNHRVALSYYYEHHNEFGAILINNVTGEILKSW